MALVKLDSRSLFGKASRGWLSIPGGGRVCIEFTYSPWANYFETNVPHNHQPYDVDFKIGVNAGFGALEFAFNILSLYVPPADALELHQEFSRKTLEWRQAGCHRLEHNDVVDWIKKERDRLNARELASMTAQVSRIEHELTLKPSQRNLCDHPFWSLEFKRSAQQGEIREATICRSCDKTLEVTLVTVPVEIRERVVERVVDRIVKNYVNVCIYCKLAINPYDGYSTCTECRARENIVDQIVGTDRMFRLK